MILFYSDTFELPLPDGHRFPMSKYRLLRERVGASDLLETCELRLPPAASDAELSLAHDAEYVERVQQGELSDLEIRRIGFSLVHEDGQAFSAVIGGKHHGGGGGHSLARRCRSIWRAAPIIPQRVVVPGIACSMIPAWRREGEPTQGITRVLIPRSRCSPGKWFRGNLPGRRNDSDLFVALRRIIRFPKQTAILMSRCRKESMTKATWPRLDETLARMRGEFGPSWSSFWQVPIPTWVIGWAKCD